MTETKIYCDHCRKQLDPMSDYEDVKITMAHFWHEADLCADCLEKLHELVDEFCITGAMIKELTPSEMNKVIKNELELSDTIKRNWLRGVLKGADDEEKQINKPTNITT